MGLGTYICECPYGYAGVNCETSKFVGIERERYFTCVYVETMNETGVERKSHEQIRCVFSLLLNIYFEIYKSKDFVDKLMDHHHVLIDV